MYTLFVLGALKLAIQDEQDYTKIFITLYLLLLFFSCASNYPSIYDIYPSFVIKCWLNEKIHIAKRIGLSTLSTL